MSVSFRFLCTFFAVGSLLFGTNQWLYYVVGWCEWRRQNHCRMILRWNFYRFIFMAIFLPVSCDWFHFFLTPFESYLLVNWFYVCRLWWHQLRLQIGVFRSSLSNVWHDYIDGITSFQLIFVGFVWLWLLFLIWRSTLEMDRIGCELCGCVKRPVVRLGHCLGDQYYWKNATGSSGGENWWNRWNWWPYWGFRIIGSSTVMAVGSMSRFPSIFDWPLVKTKRKIIKYSSRLIESFQ